MANENPSSQEITQGPHGWTLYTYRPPTTGTYGERMLEQVMFNPQEPLVWYREHQLGTTDTSPSIATITCAHRNSALAEWMYTREGAQRKGALGVFTRISTFEVATNLPDQRPTVDVNLYHPLAQDLMLTPPLCHAAYVKGALSDVTAIPAAYQVATAPVDWLEQFRQGQASYQLLTLTQFGAQTFSYSISETTGIYMHYAMRELVKRQGKFGESLSEADGVYRIRVDITEEGHRRMHISYFRGKMRIATATATIPQTIDAFGVRDVLVDTTADSFLQLGNKLPLEVMAQYGAERIYRSTQETAS